MSENMLFTSKHPDNDYKVSREASHRDTRTVIGVPTGNVSSNGFIQLRMEDGVIRECKFSLQWPVFAMPSIEWFIENSIEFYCVVTFMEGFREYPLVIGIVPTNYSDFLRKHGSGSNVEVGSSDSVLRLEKQAASPKKHGEEGVDKTSFGGVVNKSTGSSAGVYPERAQLGFPDNNIRVYKTSVELYPMDTPKEDVKSAAIAEKVVDKFEKLIDLLVSAKVSTSLGPQPLMNFAQIQQLKNELGEIKSELVKLV